jgi:hypothetical protein
LFRPSAALQRFGSLFTRARSSEKLVDVRGKSFCEAFQNGNSRVLKPSLKTTDISPINLCIDCESFLGKAVCTENHIRVY